MANEYYLDDGRSAGSIWGHSDGKVGYFGTAPTVQKGTTSFAQVPAATSTVATTATLEVVSNNNRTKINTLLTELIAKGFIASS